MKPQLLGLGLSIVFAATVVVAQMTPPSGTTANRANAGGAAESVHPDLDRLQSAASRANLELGQMRIDKWKVDSDSRHQAQSNADSVQRNLSTALPELIQAVRTAPQDLNANFKLYRNLNALYDVMATLTESTGAFGSRGDYEALSQQLDTIDSVRRNLGDSLERMTSYNQAQIIQLQNQLRAAQQRAAVAAVPPKKVVVDDNTPKPTAHKKKPSAKKPTSSTSSASQNGSQSTGNPNAPVQPPASHQ